MLGWLREATEAEVAAAVECEVRAYGSARDAACLPFAWHGVWALAEWAAKHHGFTPDPSAVVLRTRPDVLLSTPLDIRALRAYFADGEHGRHLALGQSVPGRFSWKVYHLWYSSLVWYHVVGDE